MYTNLLQLDDDTTHMLVGRERPSLLFDRKTGRPTHLYNGAIDSAGPWYSMVQALRQPAL